MMKILYSTLLFLLISLPALPQANVAVSTGFDNYAGTLATVPQGWYISWNSTSSFYTSAGNFGDSSPSYKFGNDSDFVVAPAYPMIDSVSFFVKGNGGPFSPLNELRIYE